MSHDEIAQRSGLSKSMVSTISRMRSWEHLSLSTVDRFSQACGVNLLKPNLTRRYIRTRKLAHVMSTQSPNQSRLYFDLMMMAKGLNGSD